MSENIKVSVPPEASGTRADVFLAEQLPEFSRTAVQRLLEQGMVECGGKFLKKNAKLSGGEQLSVTLSEPEPIEAVPQNIPLDILYEDDDLLVVNKPKGLVVHPAPGHPDGTLVNALLYHCGDSLSGIGGAIRPGILHRIDKDTSGLLLVAKNDTAHNALSEQISSHTFTRCYEAVVYGKLTEKQSVSQPIGRNPRDRKTMAVRPDGKPATTHITPLRLYDGFTHISAKLETGRTHQIRVHTAYIGHPVAGDAVYGPKKCITSLHGQCLHAKTLGFVHPRSREYMEFSAPLPPYFTKFLQTLRPKEDNL